MRRTRIKALATVPIRRKIVQGPVISTDSNSTSDKEYLQKDILNTDKSKQEITGDSARIQEKITEDKQKANFVESGSIVTKSDSQEQCTQVNDTPKEIKDELDQKSILSSETFTVTDIDILNTDKSKQEITKDSARIQEKITEDEQKANFKESESIATKSNSQEQCTRVSDKSREIIDQLDENSISPSKTPIVVNLVSPVKTIQNRSCFMRPSPRLDGSGRMRKNSIQGSGASASESEDEHGKRISITPNCIKNDSTCSIQNNKSTSNENTINDSPSVSPIKTSPKRRILISESARKLAEARREFLLKHENKTPDRSQLKMYDLIYYNPTRNPMKKSNTPTVVSRQIMPQSEEISSPLEDENEDDPSAMPAPQVKVGPDGQLIIDEQSLVIEQTSAKKNREIWAQDAIVDDDNYYSGFYKKRQKSKEWPRWETFKFYRALNVVGTDFLLMQSVFPNRTRQQIKQKYKKEERVNRHLVEKALKYHQEFNTEMLEEQLAMLQEFENTNADKKSSRKSKNRQGGNKNAKKRKHRIAATSIAECEISDQETEDTIMLTIDNETDMEVIDKSNNRHQKIRKRNKQKKRLLSEKSDNSSDFSSNIDSDSDIEVYRVRPTRSGRLPKVKRLQGPNINTLDNSAEEKSLANTSEITVQEIEKITNSDLLLRDTKVGANMSYSENIEISGINEIGPGSFILLTKDSLEEPGNTILQLYMVSKNIDDNDATIKSNITPGNLQPELLSTINNKIDDESIGITDDCE